MYVLSVSFFREFTNGKGQTVLLQLYSPSGGFTYPHRQLLGRIFSESYPKGYWVSRESFESALKRKHLHGAGKLKSNAWTLSALVNPTPLKERFYSPDQEEEALASLEADLINNLAREKDRIVNAIKAEPGTENAKFHFLKVDLTDENQPGYESQIAALGFFATNNPSLDVCHEQRAHQQDIPMAVSCDRFKASVMEIVQHNSDLPFYMPNEAALPGP